MARKKSERQKLTTKLDTVFSKLIRLRNDYICEKCGIDCSNTPGKLDCSHYIGRANTHTRWYSLNASAHCKKCHLNFTHRYWEHQAWFRTVIGQGVEDLIWERIRERDQAMLKYTINDLRDMLEHYDAEYSIMKSKRDAGIKGYLEFTDYD
jgi:hypothetical protein